MQNINIYIHKIFFLIDKDYKQIVFMSFYFILAAFFDLIGLGTLFIFIQGILNYDEFINNIHVNNVLYYFPYLQISKLHFFFITSIFLLLIFFIKTITSIYVQAKIIDYSLLREKILRNRLINYYINLDYLKFTKKSFRIFSDFIW